MTKARQTEQTLDKYLIVIVGPTASGKTDLSIEIALKYNAEILSADSRQFYRELSIGTAVPDKDQLLAVKHHFIHNKSVTDYYNSYQYEADAVMLLEKYFLTNQIAVLTGGSGMYVDAVCNGIDLIPDVDPEIREMLMKRLENEGSENLRFELKKRDPEYYSTVDLKNNQRIVRALEVCLQTGKPFSSFRTSTIKERPFKIIKVGLNHERDVLYRRINNRVDKMMEEGLLEEAEGMIGNRNYYALKTVGYREMFSYFDKEINLDKAIELIKRNTRHFARRQMTWFGKDKNIKWFNAGDISGITEFIEIQLSGK